jgi:hypothetical protein
MTDDPADTDPWSDRWIRAHLAAIGLKRLHAIGVITLRWNLCEYALFLLFCEMAQVSEQKGRVLAHKLGDVDLSERINALAKLPRVRRDDGADAKEIRFGADAKELIKNATDYYDKCRQNRNSVVHAWTRRVDGELHLARRSKKMVQMDVEPFASSLPDLRRVAEEMGQISHQLFVLEYTLRENDVSQPMPWLEKLPLPTLLLGPRAGPSAGSR